ncbi:sensor histidine kinase [[Eubacterium] cellulosolvens]
MKVPKGRLFIQGDSIRLSQALINLLNNASKFTPERGKIELSVENMKESIQVQVKDSGIGIRKKDLERIFEPFANIKKPNYIKGTGLGLSLTKGFVEAHGGKIWVESSGEGKGAEFTFTLPKVESVYVRA